MDDAATDEVLDALVHRGDLDGLVRLIDDRCATRDWQGVLRVRDRARGAVHTGRQLWSAATLAEYRLALLAPAAWACHALDEESGRFAIGPLTEVAAQHHTYAELTHHLPTGPRLGFLAHERALRGERIPAGTPNPLDIPFELQPWEPEYPLPAYGDDGMATPAPARPPAAAFRHVEIRRRAEPVQDTSVELAVRQLFDAWTSSSNGRVDVVCIEGGVERAVGALGVHHPGLAPLSTAEAMAWLAWAGASGGAHGRRRGMAAGRFAAWWLLAAIGDLLDDWPVQPGVLHSLADGLRWCWWDAGEPAVGWEVQLAVEDPTDGYAWAISAHDAD